MRFVKHRNRINRTARPERLAYRAETWFDGCDGAGCGFRYRQGFNDPKLHDELVASYEQVIPMVAEAGLTNLICFAGRRNGVTDLQGWENCEKGLKRLMPIAEKYNVVLTMELLNSVGHKDYLCDHTVWGAELCRRIGSPNFKLLYDIYHMQIMEGNVIEHIGNITSISLISIPEAFPAVRRSTKRRNSTIRLS